MEKSKQKAIIFIGIVIILFYWFMENLSVVGDGISTVFGLCFPFIVGGAIAFILNVPMRFIERHLFQGKNKKKFDKIRRPVAFILTILVIVLIFTGVLFVVIPEIGKTIMDLIDRVPKAFDTFWKWAENLLVEYPIIMKYVENLENLKIDWDSILQNVVGFFSIGTKGIISSGIGMISGVVSGVTTSFVAIVFSIYILFQKETLARQGKKVIYALIKKERAEKILRILDLTGRTFASFLSGQCLEAVILGSMFVITMLIFRIPYAWLTGVIIAITALIPLVGAFIGCFVGAFLILMVSPIKAVFFVILFLVLQQIEGNLVYPHVVGKSVGLPGMWVLVAVILGGNILGVFGMLVFIPVFSVLYVLFREFVNKRLQEKKIKVH